MYDDWVQLGPGLDWIMFSLSSILTSDKNIANANPDSELEAGLIWLICQNIQVAHEFFFTKWVTLEIHCNVIPYKYNQSLQDSIIHFSLLEQK